MWGYLKKNKAKEFFKRNRSIHCRNQREIMQEKEWKIFITLL